MDFSKLRKYTTKGQDIYVTPKEGKHTETLVWMHGLGDTAEGWFDVFYSGINGILPVTETTKVVLLTAPSASVTLNGGMIMPSWYDIKDLSSRNFERSFGLEEVEENSKRITKVMDEELDQLGESTKLFIGGFSQGCVMSFHCGLGYTKTLGGIMGCSGYLFPMTKESKANEKTPIFLSHGADDELLPYKACKASFSRLNKDRMITEVVEPRLGHGINENILRAMNKFFKSVLKKL